MQVYLKCWPLRLANLLRIEHKFKLGITGLKNAGKMSMTMLVLVARARQQPMKTLKQWREWFWIITIMHIMHHEFLPGILPSSYAPITRSNSAKTQNCRKTNHYNAPAHISILVIWKIYFFGTFRFLAKIQIVNKLAMKKFIKKLKMKDYNGHCCIYLVLLYCSHNSIQKQFFRV